MRVVDGLSAFNPPSAGTVLTIGNFDGVHRGHQRIVNAALAIARDLATPVVAITFDPHPIAILAPERAPAQLTTRVEKLALLARYGVNEVIVLQSNQALLSMSADHFLRELVARCCPRFIVEGPTFNFGHDRRGSNQTLLDHAAELNYRVEVVEEFPCAELPGRPEVNSSSIRAALRDGRVADAAAMLGRPHRVTGIVTPGDARGATIGFPTANLTDVPQLLPAQAVYAAIAQLDTGELRLAAVNIGPQPTFDQAGARVEAHLLDFSDSLYGRPMGLHFLERIRGQVRFAGVDELVAQIRADVARCRKHIAPIESMSARGAIPLT